MEKEFCLGLALGMLGGALLIANNKNLRTKLVKKQTELLNKLNRNDD